MRSNRKAEFDALYNEHRDRVFQAAASITGDLHTAEDILQEVFLRYYLYTEHSVVDTPKSWLLTTAKNLARNYKRKYRKEMIVDMREYGDDNFAFEKSAETLFFRKLWKREKMVYSDRILRALKKKNEKWYDAVTYIYCMEIPRKDIAQLMGITVDALDGLLYRSKNWIEINYREEYDRINQK